LALRPHPSRQRLRIRFFTAGPLPKRRSERRSAPRPGSATHGYKDPNTKPLRRRPSRHCSRVRRPRFPHLALKPHPSRHGSESASSQPAHCQKDVRRGVRRGVRRRDRGQRPTATKDPNPEQRRRRPSRHCSRVRRPRFPQLALRPHPSRQRLRIRFFAAGPMTKRRSERRSAPRPGSATHGYKRSEYETTTQVC
jgi:hypothetical protein